MKIKERNINGLLKLYFVVFYFLAVLIVTGYIGTYTLGILMSFDSPEPFDPAQFFYMLFGALILPFFGWPLLLAAALMYAILLPIVSRLSLRLIGPVLPIVIIIAIIQAIFLSRFIGDPLSVVSIAILTIAITVPTHLITLLFAHAYCGKEPGWISKRNGAGGGDV